MKISALGPAGSFSELAAMKFIENLKKYDENLYKSVTIELYPGISQAIDAIGVETDMGVIPIENMVEGYVSPTLDRFVFEDLRVVAELYLPVEFSFVAHVDDISHIERAYVQFVTQGQCVNYISKLPKNVDIITTDSNSQSYEIALKGVRGEGAVVPIHLGRAAAGYFDFIENNICDSSMNMTRFFVISKKNLNFDFKCGEKRKTSIMVTETKKDEPGTLLRILTEFKDRGINLTSIASRPTKKDFGSYYFYMDLDGDIETSESMRDALEAVETFNRVLILGSYSHIKDAQE